MDRRSFLSAVAAVAAGAPFINSAVFATPVEAATPVQSVILGSATPGGPLSLSVLDEAIAAVGSPAYLLMSKRMRNLLSSGNPDQNVFGHLTWEKDETGQRQAYYRGILIAATDYDGENEQTIDFNEGGDHSTSIYILADTPEVNEAMADIYWMADTVADKLIESSDAPPVYGDTAAFRAKWNSLRNAGTSAIHRKLMASAPTRINGIGKKFVVA